MKTTEKYLRQYIRKIIFESMIGLEELDGIIAPPPDKTTAILGLSSEIAQKIRLRYIIVTYFFIY